MALALGVSISIGIFNGYLVTKTGIPSFLITLSALFMLFGINLGLTKLVTNAVSTRRRGRARLRRDQGVLRLPAAIRRSGEGGPQFSILILWWLVFVAVATYVLMRTRIGNWIFASGGNAASARAVGVPTKRVKIGLFAFVGFSAWFYAMHSCPVYNTVQAGSGVGGEFLYIIAAVVGGCALTGGLGSPGRLGHRGLDLRDDRAGDRLCRLGPTGSVFLGSHAPARVLLNLYVKRISERI